MGDNEWNWAFKWKWNDFIHELATWNGFEFEPKWTWIVIRYEWTWLIWNELAWNGLKILGQNQNKDPQMTHERKTQGS